MTKPDLGLPSAIKDSTYQQNRENEFEYNKANFNHLVYEVLRLRRQRTETLMELLEATREANKQKSIIVDLYSRLNYDTGVSPLKMVV